MHCLPAPLRFISVTNLGATIDGYFLRGTCVAPPDIPCPRPLPHEGECSNANDGSGEFRGTCSQVRGLGGWDTRVCVHI
jgi:hypothetical protein